LQEALGEEIEAVARVLVERRLVRLDVAQEVLGEMRR
jgi:hydroxymethylglutaryl-CoA reductase